jgi:hypothetical protein
MTKKITCRVIDSIPLDEENSQMHIGWGFSGNLYGEKTPKCPDETFVVKNTSDCSTQKNALDFYA